MGRSEPTFRMLLDRLEGEWADFRRGLRTDEQRAFDALFQKARAHASSSSHAARVEAMESVFMSILLEHEREIARLRREVAALRAGREVEPLDAASQTIQP